MTFHMALGSSESRSPDSSSIPGSVGRWDSSGALGNGSMTIGFGIIRWYSFIPPVAVGAGLRASVSLGITWLVFCSNGDDLDEEENSGVVWNSLLSDDMDARMFSFASVSVMTKSDGVFVAFDAKLSCNNSLFVDKFGLILAWCNCCTIAFKALPFRGGCDLSEGTFISNDSTGTNCGIGGSSAVCKESETNRANRGFLSLC